MKKGTKASKEFRKKRSDIMKKQWKDKNFKKLMSEKHIRITPWNNGLTKETSEILKKSGIKISKNKERNIKQSKTNVNRKFWEEYFYA